MAELIYNIENIFSTENSECCLVEYDAKKFHVPAYQRGYKWASDKYGAVTILLNDLQDAFNAFENEERKEYYLQYITLKKDSNSDFLEVIDGQQRLTTLSILLSIIALKLEIENLAKGKLDYAIRKNFFEQYIYNTDNLKVLIEMTWVDNEGLTLPTGNSINNQDVYYLFNAVKAINNFYSKEFEGDLNLFYDFILKNVKIIVNVVDHVSSEKVFSNLNSNKVPLTEAELIKGLLLTKFSRFQNKDESKKHFREILEMRMSLGRQWDEMSRWCNQPEIKTFFFKGEEGMSGLLSLVAVLNGFQGSKGVNPNDYPLFNFYHKLADIKNTYEQILKVYYTLKDWYNEDKIYNLLGFLFFAKGSKFETSDILQNMTLNKSELFNSLKSSVEKIIPTNPDLLYYRNDQDDEIHRTLLALNVFIEGSVKRFDYYRFVEEKWTLEHIFPQTPEGKGQKLEEKDKELIIEILGNKITDEIKQILAKDERTSEEKEIYQLALKSVGDLDSIGNMCLLTNKDNISNGCGFFNEKRRNILYRIRKGSFVPKHTFDVFSKMVFESNPGDFERWTFTNIHEHIAVIKKCINSLKFD